MDEAKKQATLSAIRSVLVIIGSVLTAHGVADDAMVQQVIGLAMTVIPLAWGAYEGWRKERKAAEREAIALNAGIAVANASPTNIPPVHPIDVPAVIAEFSPPKEGK